MSDLGSSQAPAKPDDIPLWLLWGLVAVLLVGLGLTGFVVLEQRRGEHGDAATYPASWDPRLVRYVRIAEKDRGLAFVHPVAVRFLPAHDFEKAVRDERGDLDKEDREQLKRTTGLLRALGLLSGDVDIIDALTTASTSSTLAYYSFDDQRITVRGTKVTPSMRSTLVHELTHALQDQHFDVGAKLDALQKDEKEDRDTTTEASVLDAIVEGDARRVETIYRDSLGPKQKRALDRSAQRSYDATISKVKGVPPFLLTMISSPYVLGEALTTAAAGEGGNAAVDTLFRVPPHHDVALLDPLSDHARSGEAAAVDVPKLHSGEKKFDSGEFGAVTWYFLLAERMPIVDALDVADGWGGDAYVAFERGGRSCIRAAYAGRTASDTARMQSALQHWGAAGSAAKVTRDGSQVVLESCDPGAKATGGKDASQDALNAAALRAGFGIGIVRAGGSHALARCVSDRLVHAYPASVITDPHFDGNSALFRARVQQLVADCR